MGKVQLKLPPSFIGDLDEQRSDMLTLEHEIGEGSIIGDLLAETALRYAEFRKSIFDTNTRTVSDEVMVILNRNVLQGSEITEAKLADGDTVMLLPVFAGG